MNERLAIPESTRFSLWSVGCRNHDGTDCHDAATGIAISGLSASARRRDQARGARHLVEAHLRFVELVVRIPVQTALRWR